LPARPAIEAAVEQVPVLPNHATAVSQ